MRGQGATPRIVVRTAGRTDRGKLRQRNEDSFALADLTTDEVVRDAMNRDYSLGNRGALFMVADGMGGVAGGAVASSMAIDIVLAELRNRGKTPSADGPEPFAIAIRSAVERANAQIHQHAATHVEGQRMGTTATVAGLLGDTLCVAQIGDSRAYLVRDGRAHQLTRDQSLVQELIESGQMTREQAAVSSQRNIVMQALGPEPVVTVDLTRHTVRQGDVLVLCTDGLSGLVADEEIAHAVSRESDLDAVCRRLVDRANERGGPDNITVIVALVDGPGLAIAPEGEAIGHEAFALAEPDRGANSSSDSEIPYPVAGQRLGTSLTWLRTGLGIAALLALILLLYVTSS